MKLIINADDFGLSKSISDGIIDGVRGGYITSTSVMVNMPFAKYAIEKAVKNKIDCVGLHIVLTTGKPILANRNLTDDNGDFYYNRTQIDRDDLKYEDVYNEVKAQINLFFKLGKNKLHLNHLNLHHFLYNKTMRKVVFDIAKECKVPVRNELGVSFSDKKETKGVVMPDLFFSDWSIVNVNYDYLKQLVEKHKKQDVVVELMTHSGYVDDYTKTITSYTNRNVELDILKQAKEKGLFDGVKLASFDCLKK